MADKKKPSVLGRILVNLLLGANVMTLVLLWACCASTWIDPSLHPRISVFGLAFPFFLLVNLLFVPFWLLFKPRMLVVPVLGMIFCGSYILDYFPLRLGSATHSDSTLTVLTWNIHNPHSYNRDSVDVALDYMRRSQADIICLQEFNRETKSYKPFIEAMQADGYYVDGLLGRTILSRYPILSQRRIDGETYSLNGAVVFQIAMGDDTLSLFNVHLECNRLTEDEKDEYGEVLRTHDQDRMKSGMRMLHDKLSSAARYRATQVHALTQCLDSLQGHSVILCGDFNDTPISYAYQQISRRLDNAYRQGGRGVGVTYSERLFPVRIDHIFCSDQWRCTEARVDVSMGASDHYPVIAKLEKQQK